MWNSFHGKACNEPQLSWLVPILKECMGFRCNFIICFYWRIGSGWRGNLSMAFKVTIAPSLQ